MSCMECLHTHISSCSPTPSHMSMPSVTTVIGSTNDTHIVSPYRLTSTQCKFQWATNPESIPTPITQLEVYVITMCLILGNGSFWITPRVSYTHVLVINMTVCPIWATNFFGSHRESLTTNVPGFSPEEINNPLLAPPNTLIIFHFML